MLYFQLHVSAHVQELLICIACTNFVALLRYHVRNDFYAHFCNEHNTKSLKNWLYAHPQTWSWTYFATYMDSLMQNGVYSFRSHTSWHPRNRPKLSFDDARMQIFMQILPQLLNWLELDNEKIDCLDWGAIAVYSCAKSCTSKDAYVEEFVFVQPPWQTNYKCHWEFWDKCLFERMLWTICRQLYTCIHTVYAIWICNFEQSIDLM